MGLKLESPATRHATEVTAALFPSSSGVQVLSGLLFSVSRCTSIMPGVIGNTKGKGKRKQREKSSEVSKNHRKQPDLGRDSNGSSAVRDVSKGLLNVFGKSEVVILLLFPFLRFETRISLNRAQELFCTREAASPACRSRHSFQSSRKKNLFNIY